MNTNLQTYQSITDQFMNDLDFKEIFKEFLNQNQPSNFSFGDELNQIKYFHRCLINTKLQLDFLREFVEIENKGLENISNTKNSFFDKFNIKTEKFSKEPSEILNHIKNFTNFLFQYLNIHQDEIFNTEVIYLYLSEFNSDYNSQIKNFLSTVSILMKILIQIIDEYKKKTNTKKKLKDEIKQENQFFHNLTPYEVSEREKKENKILNLRNKMNKLKEELKHRTEFLENKKNELNLAIRNCIENYVKIIIKWNFITKQILSNIFKSKLNFSCRMKKSKENFYLELSEIKYIYLNELAERKFSVDVKGIFYESFENLKNSFEQIKLNAELNSLNTPDHLNFVLINLNYLIQYLDNFSSLFYYRKKILKSFVELISDLLKNFINVKIENFNKLTKIIKSFSNNLNNYEDYVDNDQNLTKLKNFFNFPIWSGDEKNSETFKNLNSNTNSNFFDLFQSLTTEFEELKLFLTVNFIPEMKKTNEIYKNDTKEFSLIKSKYKKEIFNTKSEAEKLLLIFRNNPFSNNDSMPNTNELNKFTTFLGGNKLKKVSTCVNEFNEILKLIRENENFRIKKFLFDMRNIFNHVSSIIDIESKSYENLSDMIYDFNVNEQLNYLLEPYLNFSSMVDPFFRYFMIHELKTFFQNFQQDEKNLHLYNFPKKNLIVKLDQDQGKISRAESDSFRYSYYQYFFNFLNLKKFEEITEENLNDSENEQDQADQLEPEAECSDKIKSLPSFRRAVSDLSNAENQQPLQNFVCALKSKILIQGKLYLFEDCLIFKSWFNVKTIFGETKIIIPIEDILSIRKVKHLKIFNNGISISTRKLKKISFVSFMYRDKCFDMIEHLINKRKIRVDEIEEKPCKEREEGEDEETYFKGENENGVKYVENNSQVDEASYRYVSNIPEDFNHIFYKNLYLKKILKETNFVHRLESYTNVQFEKLLKIENNIKSEFYHNKIYENEYISKIPANFIYKVMFSKDFKIKALNNKSFIESLLDERQDKNISINSEDETNPKIPNYINEQNFFPNIIYNLNKNSMEEFLKQIESCKVDDYFNFSIEYTHPMKSMFLPSKIKMTEKYKSYFVSPLLIIVTRSTYTDGTPYDESFHTEMQYRIETKILLKSGNKFSFKTSISNYFTIVFSKSVWMKKVIEKEGIKLANDIEKKSLVELKNILKDEEKKYFNELKENFEKLNVDDEEYKKFVEDIRSSRITKDKGVKIENEILEVKNKKTEIDDKIEKSVNPSVKSSETEFYENITKKKEFSKDNEQEIVIKEGINFYTYYPIATFVLIVLISLRGLYKIIFRLDIDCILDNLAVIAILLFVYKNSF